MTTPLSEQGLSRLGAHLEHLYASVDAHARVQRDPVAFPRRYPRPEDAEIAGIVASVLAYGRVELFRPVIASVLALADEAGGPRAWVEGFDARRDGAALRPLVYRWNRGIDVVLLAAALRRVLDGRRVEHAFAWESGDVADALDGLIVALREAAVAEARGCGVHASSWSELPRGLRTMLPRPADGSACKRWMMYLRWMIRPPREGVDLGLWSVPPAALLMPVDTHVLRLAGLLGLTDRRDGSLRTSREITAALARLDAHDPVRFDFALAHLGISGACTRVPDPAVCPSCTLQPVCIIGRRAGRPRAPRRATRK